MTVKSLICVIFLSTILNAQDAFTLDEVKDLSKIVGLAWAPYKPAPADLVLPSRYFSYCSSENASIIEKGAIMVDAVKKQIAISLPGTLNMPDFLVDMEASHKQLSWMDGSAHAGFLNEFDNILPGLIPALEAISHDIGQDLKEFSVVTLGHSKGGAIAQILAAYLYTAVGFKNMRVLTIASPLLFNKAAKIAYNNILDGKTLHLIERADLIPYLPPGLFGFERTGYVLYVDCSNIVHKLEGYEKSLDVMDSSQFKISKEKAFPSFNIFKFKSYLLMQYILSCL